MVGYPRIELGVAEPADLQSAASPLMLLPHGTPKENRTPLPAVKGRCPNR